MKLTKTDKRILKFIKDYMLENGTTPTIRDICNEMGYYSTASGYMHYKRLVDLGYIIPITGNSSRYRVRGMRYTDDL